MPIRSRTNQYIGINAHLNSLLQHRPGGWRGFHTDHITDLRRTLEAVLPPGYIARTEESLQIERRPLGGEPRADIVADLMALTSETSRRRAPIADAPTATVPVAEFPLPDTLQAEDYFFDAIVITDSSEQPVTRIELFSPTNKPPHPYHQQYLAKRADTLHAGVHMVEIDYIHEQRPVLPNLPSYKDGMTGAYPFTVVVGIARPSLWEGTARLYGWHVDDPIPTITVPLLGDDQAVWNLNLPYKQTYEGAMAHASDVDYTQLPINFDRYSPDDQARIQRRMEIVRRAVELGLDLEQGPFSAQAVGL